MLTPIVKTLIPEHDGHSFSYPRVLVASVIRPTLLYLSPTLPSETGNGSALRADLHIEMLARSFDVILVVVQLYKERTFCKVPSPLLLTRCKQVLVIPGKTAASSIPGMLVELGSWMFDRVHVFRLRMHPYLGYFKHLIRPGACHTLDLDDFESKKHLRFAALLASQGNEQESLRLQQIARRLSTIEREAVPFYDSVCISNADDQAELAAAYGASKIIVLSNALRLPLLSAERRATDGNCHCIVFVGSMQYFPNEDGVLFFVNSVLAAVRSRALKPVKLTIVGTRPSERLRLICERNDVAVTGEVSSVAGYYQQADLAIVPIRTGGGTRIKLLEAFSHRIPVVSTALGAEGLSVENGKHLLIADSESEFADACLEVLNNPAAGARLAECAYTLVCAQYTIESMAEGFRLLAGRG